MYLGLNSREISYLSSIRVETRYYVFIFFLPYHSSKIFHIRLLYRGCKLQHLWIFRDGIHGLLQLSELREIRWREIREIRILNPHGDRYWQDGCYREIRILTDEIREIREIREKTDRVHSEEVEWLQLRQLIEEVISRQAGREKVIQCEF